VIEENKKKQRALRIALDMKSSRSQSIDDFTSVFFPSGLDFSFDGSLSHFVVESSALVMDF
jgi:hypothetical protein